MARSKQSGKGGKPAGGGGVNTLKVGSKTNMNVGERAKLGMAMGNLRKLEKTDQATQRSLRTATDQMFGRLKPKDARESIKHSIDALARGGGDAEKTRRVMNTKGTAGQSAGAKGGNRSDAAKKGWLTRRRGGGGGQK